MITSPIKIAYAVNIQVNISRQILVSYIQFGTTHDHTSSPKVYVESSDFPYQQSPMFYSGINSEVNLGQIGSMINFNYFPGFEKEIIEVQLNARKELDFPNMTNLKPQDLKGKSLLITQPIKLPGIKCKSDSYSIELWVKFEVLPQFPIQLFSECEQASNVSCQGMHLLLKTDFLDPYIEHQVSPDYSSLWQLLTGDLISQHWNYLSVTYIRSLDTNIYKYLLNHIYKEIKDQNQSKHPILQKEFVYIGLLNQIETMNCAFYLKEL
ncbi:UNKNOWN [Stylonychia lemnae]|uniref:Uncharacterized protein n=1 Tax=Stylonychia lemnae TaxID=5949 RepID=A0A078B2B9_STYLE|nr:UNKNOWN [Stylonychia lemnae]|eukprot:CDW87618.1 UNKNOWN [Stylonychia lemnae]